MSGKRACLAWLGLSLGIVSGALAGPENAPDVNTETLWRGVLHGDSLFVRASWVPTVGSSRCISRMGQFDDSSSIRPQYLEYWIEDGRGHVRTSESVSEPDFQFCCDGLSAEGTRWLGGLVIKLGAYGCCCEPAGDCEKLRFIYLAGGDSVAHSEWTYIPWDPAVDGATNASAEVACIVYPMTLRARLRGTAITFEPSLPPGTKEGDLLEKTLDEIYTDCPRSEGPREPVAIELFPTGGSRAAKRIVIRTFDSIEILSVVLRAERSTDRELTPKLFRVEIRAVGQQGFVSPASLRSLGFLEF